MTAIRDPNKRHVQFRDGTIRVLEDGERFVLPDGASLHVPLMLMDHAPPPDDARAEADQAHAEMVRTITMAHRHPSDREPPSEDREQAYAKMREDISNAWQRQSREHPVYVKPRPIRTGSERPSSAITESQPNDPLRPHLPSP